VSTGWTSRATEPRARRIGTTRANTPGGVLRSRREPAADAVAARGRLRASQRPAPVNSLRDVATEPGQQATSATRLATPAASGVSPVASSAGYETSEVIPPAVPTSPATAPATRRKTNSPAADTIATVAAAWAATAGQPAGPRPRAAELTWSPPTVKV
jgi:hypothetical protein